MIRKTSLIFVFLFTKLFVIAQIKVPQPSTIWVYDYTNVALCGPLKAQIVSDTVVAGKSALLINQTLYNRCVDPGDEYPEVIAWESNILHIKDSMVYFWNQDRFDTLYDFKAETGDAWKYYHFDEETKATVIQTFLDDNLGVALVLEYKIKAYEPRRDTVYEMLLGGSGYIFPQDYYEGFVDGQMGGPLVCFSNSKGNYQNKTWTNGGKTCQHEIDKLDVTVLNIAPSIKIYPNPTDKMLYVDGLKGAFQVRIFNLVGNQVYGQELAANPIDVSDLTSGNYVLVLETLNNIQRFVFQVK